MRFSGYDLGLVSRILACLVGGEEIKQYDPFTEKKLPSKMEWFPFYTDSGSRLLDRVVVGYDKAKTEEWESTLKAGKVSYTLDPQSYSVLGNRIEQNKQSKRRFAKKSVFNIWGDHGGNTLFETLNDMKEFADDEDEDLFPIKKPQEFGVKLVLKNFKNAAGKSGVLEEGNFDSPCMARLKRLLKAWTPLKRDYDAFVLEQERLNRRVVALQDTYELRESDMELSDLEMLSDSSSEEDNLDWM